MKLSDEALKNILERAKVYTEIDASGGSFDPKAIQSITTELLLLREFAKRAKYVIKNYSECDGYCAKDEYVCSTKIARAFQSSDIYKKVVGE